MKTHDLVGKTIHSVELTSDKKAIKFVTDAGDVVAKCDGDCCSSTWIEHVLLPFKGFPAKVTAVDELEMPDLGSPDKYDVIQYYGCAIRTESGDITIDYRNESNGYYGGDLSWPSEKYFYGGVHGQNIDNGDWQPLKADL